MIVFGVPIGIKGLPIIIKGWIRQIFIERKSKYEHQKFIFVYFSYAPDFEILQVSLRSLKANIPETKIRKIFIYVDQKKPFDTVQQEVLSAIFPTIVFNKVYNFSWGSTESSFAELGCFIQAAQNTSENDFIVKTDSDVMFLNSNRMLSLLKSRYQAVGDGHYTGCRYAQGGLYMIRSWIISCKFPGITIQDIKKIDVKTQIRAEDVTVSALIKTLGFPFELTRIMLFPDEYSKIKRINWLCRSEFCAMHFVKDKERMLLLARHLGYL